MREHLIRPRIAADLVKGQDGERFGNGIEADAERLGILPRFLAFALAGAGGLGLYVREVWRGLGAGALSVET